MNYASAAGPSATRAIAVYLPQFHPNPENDSWWGKGFTEWTNVTKARPLYPGHYQPRLPTDLGFYDLRLPETQDAQAELAKEYGLHGFCYYHYWFQGKRLLHRPLDEVLRRQQPDFPFCICWANETWSRRWLGEDREILIAQTYSDEDDREHGRWLAEVFADPRYIRVDGRPLFLIYRPMDLPDPNRTVDAIREASARAGLPDPYVLGVGGHHRGIDFRSKGFDGTVDFAPQLGLLDGAFWDKFSTRRLIRNLLEHRVLSGDLKIYDYEAAWRLVVEERPKFPIFPMVFVGWDNTARRGRRGIIVSNSTPEKFARAFQETVSSVQGSPPEQQIVFVNAWNEWAEGNHLEPDILHGRGYLEAIRAVLQPALQPA